MKALVRVAGLVLGLAPCSVTNLSAFSVPEIVGKAKPAVVQVIAVDANLNPFKTGTGFFVTGQVIGIATSTTKESQNLNFAIAVETVKTAILAEGEQRANDQSKEADTTPKFRVTTPNQRRTNPNDFAP